MIKAAKVLYTKHQRVQFVHGEQKRCALQPQEIQKILETHFKIRFKNGNANSTQEVE